MENIIYLLQFVLGLPPYVIKRGRQFVVILWVVVELLMERFNIIKTQIVSRMFWGRGGLYKNMFHLLVFTFTIGALVVSVVSRLYGVSGNSSGLVFASGQATSNDILHQGTSIQSVLSADPLAPEIEIKTHKVANGESLAGIAATYGLNIDTIRWANSTLISPFGNEIQPGWELKIPAVDGVLYQVRRGQTLEQIASITGGNILDIIEINSLVPPSYSVVVGQSLFVPFGVLQPSEVVISGIPQGVFTNPLSHDACLGYSFSRGVTSYHDGVDLAKFPGCPIRAIGAGKITYAGWSPAAGYNVKIDHGGGIHSYYYHGSGEMWVKAGDRVQQGQEIMMMGTTGNSTGVHLHLSLYKDGYVVDPLLFIPL